MTNQNQRDHSIDRQAEIAATQAKVEQAYREADGDQAEAKFTEAIRDSYGVAHDKDGNVISDYKDYKDSKQK